MIRKLFLLIVLALTTWSSAAAQHKRHQPSAPSTPNIEVVDDEACGCELVFINGIQTIQKDGLFGFKRADGTVLVEPRYQFVDKFKDGFCVVLTDYNHYGLINDRGEEVIPCVYQEVNSPTEGLARIKVADYFGFCDTTGRQVVPPVWAAASGFSEGLAVVGVITDSVNAALYGYIDREGHVVMEPQYEYAYPFSEGRAVVQSYERFGMIDRSGRTVIPCKYEVLTAMSNGRCFAQDPAQNGFALFDQSGRRLTDFLYSDVVGFGDGLYSVKRGDSYTFLDARGKERFGTYDKLGIFTQGFCWAVRGGRYGIVNAKGRVVLPFEYDNSGYRSEEYIFYEGLALVEKEGRYGYVDTKGNVVIPIEYESGYRFTEGIAPVQRKGRWGYLDHEGTTVIPFLFEAASPFRYGRAEVVYRGTTFKINPQGKCLKNCKLFPKIK